MAAPGSVQPRPPGSKAEYVHEVLRGEIMSGQLSAGSAVPQDEIARRLGVSITPVREALRRLESEGLISYRPHRGATVAELSQQAAHELYLLRSAIEGLCARLAVDRLSENDLAALREIHERMVDEHAAGQVENLAQHSRQFHDLIARAGGPAFLADHLSSIWKSHPVPAESSLWHDPTDAGHFIEAHRQLLAAFEKRDAQRAERVMVEHLELAAAARDAVRLGSLFVPKPREIPLTIAVLVLTAIPSLAQFVWPALLIRYQRDPAAIGHGEWWRAVTALVFQDGGIVGTAFNLVTLAVVGALAERLLGRVRWLALYLGGAAVGEAAGILFHSVGAGNSVAVCGLAGGLLIAGWRRGDAGLETAVAGFYALALAGTGLSTLVSGGASWVTTVAAVVVGGLLFNNRAKVPRWGWPLLGAVVGVALLALRDIHGAALTAGLLLGLAVAGAAPRTAADARDTERAA